MYKVEWTFATEKEKQYGSEVLDETLVLSVSALPGKVKSVQALLKVPLHNGEKVLMNGYQSWSQTELYGSNDRQRGLQGIPRFLLNRYKFDAYGDYQFQEYSNLPGQSHGYTFAAFVKGDHYRLFASLDENSGYTVFSYDCNTDELLIEKDWQGRSVDGNTAFLKLFYAEGTASEVFAKWFAAMGRKPLNVPKLYGYSSWYNRYEKIDESAIVQDLDGCDRILRKGDLFQIDDGWEVGVGDWQADVHKFPHGMQAAARQIHAKGYQAGLWLAPFAARADSDLARQHPDWLLRKDGKPWFGGCNWGGFYGLDIDVPGFQLYLKEVFHTVFDVWGYDLVKLDFLYAGAPFSSEKESRGERMRRGMEWLRELCGDKLIIGCGVPLASCFGLTEYCRIGPDVSLEWDDVFYMRPMHRERNSTKHTVVNTALRYPLDQLAFGNDPDVFFLRRDNIKLTEKQEKDLAELDALLGSVFLTSDDPSQYTEDMVKEYNRLRYLSEHAKVLAVEVKDTITVTYQLDGKEYSATYFG